MTKLYSMEAPTRESSSKPKPTVGNNSWSMRETHADEALNY